MFVLLFTYRQRFIRYFGVKPPNKTLLKLDIEGGKYWWWGSDGRFYATSHNLVSVTSPNSVTHDRPGEEFYSLFYLGLFSEVRGETTKAENYMRSAIKTKYAKAVGSQDYMVDVAKVHCQLRHWV